ncbi:unnamed protein product, partial [Meganyctiphanes norvegica]
DTRACTAGFFKIGNQCFKLFTDMKRSWYNAKIKCQDEGLQQAKPNDPLTLRRYIIEKYGNKCAWLGARGDNTAFKWERNGKRISSSSDLWWAGHPGRKVTKGFCLLLLSTSTHLRQQPSHPLISFICTKMKYYALCEA